MNVLVVGGGIGGITAAIALSRAGHRVTLAEKAERFAPVGAGIIMAPNATHALASLGVELSAHAFALPSLDVVRADGTLLQRIDAQRLAGEYGPTWALTRPALHAALLAALPAEVEVLKGCAVGEVNDLGAHVDVALGAEAPRRFDLVVGADGLRSAVRERLLGPIALRYSGVTCWRGLTPNPGFTRAIEAWGGEARVGVVPLRDERVYYYLVKSAPRQAPTLAWPEGFREAFGHFRGGVEQFLGGLREAPPLHHDLQELPAPVWGRGRVLLLGDAAHGMTPNQGQGAAMAIEDALALVTALDRGAEGALTRYAEKRHDRVRKVQLDSRRLGEISHWRSPLARAARDGLMRLLPASVGLAQVRRMVAPGLALLAQA